ncbi:MAG TPA: hypothetical protein VG056_09320 [Pirellulales bacterium]|jgi:hypothetical protein|nr:hypothetical protein [Pirellulales bacterium]
MLALNRKLAWMGAAIASLSVLSMFSSALADDAPPTETEAAAKSQPSPAEIAQWIKDLDSDTFATRQTAAEMLYQAGKPAIEPVAEASVGKSLEVTMQAINILHRLTQSADKETHDAANDVLERLAKSESAAAAPAKQALAPAPAANPPVANPAIIRGFGGFGGGFGGNIQIVPGGAIPAGGMQVFRIQANGANANRVADVDENGKRTHIEEDQNGIEVKVTEKVNGQDKTDTFKAKDADELKKKFPEAHKLYEKYMNGPGIGNIQGNLQIQAQAIPIQIGGMFPPGALPPGFAPPAARNTEEQKQAARDIADAQKRIAEATDRLRKNDGSTPNAGDLRRALRQLDEARKNLDEARDKLGG